MTTTINRQAASTSTTARAAASGEVPRARLANADEVETVRAARQRAAALITASDLELRQLSADLRESVFRRAGCLTASELHAKQIAGAAIAAEAARRTLGLKLFNEQLLAGLLLANEHAVELPDGEGKALSAAIPALLAWLDDQPVHVVTVDEMLAARDAAQIRPVLELLGLRVALRSGVDDLRQQYAVYQADVVYGTARDFGIDFLREQEQFDTRLRRGMMIVDDIDTVLIDKASELLATDEFNEPAHFEPDWVRRGQDVVLRRDAAHPVKSPETQLTTRQIRRQRFFRQYESLCGMTGSAIGADVELAELYGLQTIVIPRRRRSRRVDLPDRYFATTDDKLSAMADEIGDRHRTGQPVFAGGATARELRVLSEHLRRMRIPHITLTGEPARDFKLMADAGRSGAVTLARQGAGQGVGIHPDVRSQTVGGLFVVGIQRQLSRRLDRQLAARAGQRGEFGFCRFYVSADDELLQLAPTLARRLQSTAGADGEVHDQCDGLIQQIQNAADHIARRNRRELAVGDCPERSLRTLSK